jgi:hypothetical protein
MQLDRPVDQQYELGGGMGVNNLFNAGPSSSRPREE